MKKHARDHEHGSDDISGPRAPSIAPGRRTLTQQLQRRYPPVQLARDGQSGLDDTGIQAAAAHGIASGGGALPHLDTIQRAFGDHDVTGVTAHVGGAAREASHAMGAHAYATGDHVAFAEEPSLYLIAHEVAHVVQQRGGVQLSSAVGQAGDVWEQHADAVAARVVAGESAVDLLDQVAGSRGGGGASVQRKEDLELGAAGRGSHPPAEEKPAKGPGLGKTAFQFGAAVVPHVKAALAVIETIEGVWDKLKPGGGKGETKQLPEGVSSEARTIYDRIMIHRVATKLIGRAIQLAKPHVDLSAWKDGTPPPSADKGADDEVPAEAKLLVDEIRKLSVNDLQKEALLELQEVVRKSSVKIPKISYWWNGADDHGQGEPPAFSLTDSDVATWGQVTWRFDAVDMSGKEWMGMPEAARPFGVQPNAKFVGTLGWLRGGVAQVHTSEATLDDLTVKVERADFVEESNPPIGAYRMGISFEWDDSDTYLSLDVSFLPVSHRPIVIDPVTDGEPET